MESQQPRPKPRVKPLGISTVHNIIKPETSKSNVAKAGEILSKSSSNIDVGATKENRIPLSNNSLRVCPSTAVKSCKSKVADDPRSITTKQEVKKTSKKSSTTKNAPKTPPKLQKWDLRGRLAACDAEVATLKKTLKEKSELDVAINELRTEEAESRSQIEQLENTVTVLENKTFAMEELSKDAFDDVQALDNKLKESQLSLDKETKILAEKQEECDVLEELMYKRREEAKSLMIRLSTCKLQNETLNRKIVDLQSLSERVEKEKRILHNALQEVKGNIRVFCRVRPKTPAEHSKAVSAMSYVDEYTIEIAHAESSEVLDYAGNPRTTKQEFSFDKIFLPSASQAEVFEEMLLLVQSALDGYNVCVFACGQTGSGKTYTMEGGDDPETEGVIPRTVRRIFNEIVRLQRLGWRYKVRASFLEIYNEHIVDLLDSKQRHHEIRMADAKGDELYVTNLRIVDIDDPEEMFERFRVAKANRAVAATQSNERSSRSHFITRINLRGMHEGRQERLIGNLNLVDLAGSERLKNDEIARTTETKSINKSLANLGNVILAILKKQDHVPYRNSKLTHLLMPLLGGNSKTLMVLNVSPLEQDYNETVTSLRFASSVNCCRVDVKRSRTTTSTFI